MGQFFSKGLSVTNHTRIFLLVSLILLSVSGKKHIFLIGMMGAGKTTTAKWLGSQWKMPVIDSDAYIEQEVGKSVQQIFQDYGETYFRELERDFVNSLQNCTPSIISTGGGMPAQKGVFERMNDMGVVVYLHLSPLTIYSRLEQGDGFKIRPLLSGLSKEDQISHIVELYEQRHPIYKNADLVVDVINESKNTWSAKLKTIYPFPKTV